MDEKKNKIVAGVVIIVVVVGLIFFFASQSYVKCDLQEVEPAFDTKNKQNVKSSDNKALVDFNGFLSYQKDKEDKKVFLPLNFESVSYSETSNDKGTTGNMRLETNCASLVFNYNVGEERRLAVTDIDVSLVLPNGDYKSCKVQHLGIFVGPKKHYSCDVKKEYSCETTVKEDNKDVTKVVAKLVLRNLEFEVDGDPEKIKKLEFSTGKDVCLAS